MSFLSRGQADGRISSEEFNTAVKNCGYPEPPESVYKSFLTEARNFSIFNKEELAMLLAHFIYESKGFRTRLEKVDLEHYPETYKDSDCDSPGQLYHGRGYLKIKCCKNYRDISMDLFGDDRLVKKPEELILDDETAMKAGFAFWKRNVKDYPGVKEGHFGATTKAINGTECSGEYQLLGKKRYEIYKQVREAFKLKEADPSSERGCYEIQEFMKASSQLSKS